jgi:hypothetical protein
MNSKKELLGVIGAHKDNLRLIFAFRRLVYSDSLLTTFDNMVKGKETAFTQSLSLLLANKPKLHHTANEIYRALIRTALTESFQLTSYYCEKTKQTNLLEQQPWYYIFRSYRNAFDHNFKITFKDHERQHLPLVWSSLKITLADEGNDLTHNLPPPEKILEWISVLEEFISTSVT